MNLRDIQCYGLRNMRRVTVIVVLSTSSWRCTTLRLDTEMPLTIIMTRVIGLSFSEFGHLYSLCNVISARWQVLTGSFISFQVFFIMRKKFHLVTFLHVFHHAIMPCSWWLGVKFSPGRYMALGGSLLSNQVRSDMGAYAGAARRRVHLATPLVLPRPPSGHHPGRRQTQAFKSCKK